MYIKHDIKLLSDSQILAVDCLVTVDFLGNGSLDPPEILWE